MHKLIEYICDELEELERKADKEGKLSMAEVQYGDMLAHFKKNLLKSEEMLEESDYSMAGGGSGNRYRYSREGSYAGGGQGGNRGGRGGNSREGGGGNYTYARGRGRNARRDSMGRYAAGSRMDYDDDMMGELHELMNKAPNDQIKRKYREFISEMESMM